MCGMRQVSALSDAVLVLGAPANLLEVLYDATGQHEVEGDFLLLRSPRCPQVVTHSSGRILLKRFSDALCACEDSLPKVTTTD
eukprot:2392325-Rhodomonas_salina.3